MDTPTWFSDALAHGPEHKRLRVDGVDITYRVWGKPGSPVAILVHGGAAHAGWWDHIGPHLTSHHRVIAIDLSGHGDSGWRSRSEEHTSELQSRGHLVCRLLLEK